MILVRNVFKLKFGKTKEALPLVKEAVGIQKRALAGVDFSTRILTDVTGPFYTLVLELTIPNLTAWGTNAPKFSPTRTSRRTTRKMSRWGESGYREILRSSSDLPFAPDRRSKRGRGVRGLTRRPRSS